MGLRCDEQKEQLTCYKLDGTKAWQVIYGNAWTKSYQETRSTPIIDDNRLYMVSNTGELVCLNRGDGKILWSVNYWQKYGLSPNGQGICEHPLIDGGRIIVTTSGKEICMAAFDKLTGEEIWKTRAFGDKAAYVSPVMIEYKGKRQIVGSTSLTAFGVNPDNGEIEWTFDNWGPRYTGNPGRWDNIAPNSALYKDGKIFFCHGYNLNGFQLKLSDDLKKVDVTWRTETLDTHHGGYVLVNGKIYGSNWINNNDGNWCCIDWETGETNYEEKWTEGAGKGSIIAADNKLFIYDERRGFVGLVNATSEKFDVVSKFRVAQGSGPYWSHMAIDKGILYLRHGEYFAAYKIK